MFAFIKKMAPVDVRLFLAIILSAIIFVATTTPEGGSSCSATRGLGTVVVQNTSIWTIHAGVTGIMEQYLTVPPKSSVSAKVEAGIVTWYAWPTLEERNKNGAPSDHYSGNFELKKGQTVTIKISFAI